MNISMAQASDMPLRTARAISALVDLDGSQTSGISRTWVSTPPVPGCSSIKSWKLDGDVLPTHQGRIPNDQEWDTHLFPAHS
jgi:hypothetical protein